MRLLIVCRIFTGMQLDRWQISGTPAVLKLIERLEERQVTTKVLLVAKAPGDTPQGIALKPNFARFRHVHFQILPYRWRSAPKFLGGPVTWLHQAWTAWSASRKTRSDVVYVDRGNLGVAATLAWLGRRVVWRCLGVMPFALRREGGGPMRRVLGFVDRILFRAPINLVIGTLEGSPYGRIFRTPRQRERLVLLINGADRQSPAVAGSPSLEARRDLLQRHGLSDVAGPLFVSIGRLTHAKHVMETLEAYRRLTAAGVEYRALVVGYGPLENAAAAFLLDHGLSGRVAVTGRVVHGDVPGYTAAADVFLALAEGGALGNVTLEALVAGSCVVTLAPDPVRGIDGDLDALMPANMLVTVGRADVAGELVDRLTSLASDWEEVERRRKIAEEFAGQHIPSWEDRLDLEIDLIGQVARDACEPPGRPGYLLGADGTLKLAARSTG